jgi:putative glycerol-1-phosphate prenyltransferase
MKVQQHIYNYTAAGKKLLAVLIDPDHYPACETLLSAFREAEPDLILVGGSFQGAEKTGATIKQRSKVPVVIFPGTPSQINSLADGILLLSVISSRNAELLIGKQVEAAFALRESKLEIIPTGYILVEAKSMTSVQYVSQSLPVPRNKPAIAAATALAGEQLGMRAIYLEAGSGAEEPVPEVLIKSVRENTSGILICGGGIKTAEQLENVYDGGADIAVVGTALERESSLLNQFIAVRNKYNHR